MKRLPLFTSFLLFITLCVSAAYWAMQVFKPPVRPVAAPPQTVETAPNMDAADNLFGGHSTASVASNFQLYGVVVADKLEESVAILSANGKPAKTVRMNTEVILGVTVTEIQHSYVLLSENGTVKRVDIRVK